MKKKTGFQVRDIAGEKVLVAYGLENIDFSKMVSLNASAYVIWELIESNEEIDVEKLTNLVMITYDAMTEYDENTESDKLDAEKMKNIVKTIFEKNMVSDSGKEIDIEKLTNTIIRIYENYPTPNDDEEEKPLLKDEVRNDIVYLLEAWKREGLME